MAKRLNKENIVTLLRLIRSWINRKADKDALITGGVTKLGTSTVGSASKPIYWDEGEPKATSGTLDVSITGNAASATEASKATNADNASTAETAYKLGTADVGSPTLPIYLNKGVPTAGRGGVVSVTGGTKNGTISVAVGTGGTTGTTSSDVAVTGLKSLAYLDTVPKATKENYGGIKLTTNATTVGYMTEEGAWNKLNHPVLLDSDGIAYVMVAPPDNSTIKLNNNNQMYVDTKSVVSLGTALSWSGNAITPTIGTMAIGTGVTALSTGTYKNITSVTNGLADEKTVAAIADRLFELEKKVVAYLGTA